MFYVLSYLTLQRYKIFSRFANKNDIKMFFAADALFLFFILAAENAK